MWKEDKPVLLVDGGDLFGGRNRNDQKQTEFLCEATGDLGYDAIGLGEYDLNYGRAFLQEMVDKYKLPFTSANVRDTTGALLLPEYLVVERGGVKIGLISVLDPSLRIISMTGEEGAFKVDDPVATLRELIPRVRKEAQTIVLVGHLGEATTEQVIKDVKGIDIAVIGHTYRNIDTERLVNDTVLLSSAYEGRYIGRADLYLQDTDGKVMAVEVKNTSLGDDVPDDEQMKERVDAFKQSLEEFKESKRAAYPRTYGSKDEDYLGDRSCMTCHKAAWDVYSKSAHARAFSTLRRQGQSDEPECLSCHTTGYQYQNGFDDKPPYNRLTDVQCEACHGYGTEHSREKGWAQQAKDSCVTCHDQKNSPNFDYASYWAKIKH